MIGARHGTHRSVSGAGGSCFYRAIAFQLCERAGKVYDDAVQVRRLRHDVCQYLASHQNDALRDNPQLKWKDIGQYQPGYAEAPVPQAMPYVIGKPITVHVGTNTFTYGSSLAGPPLHVRLTGMHYSIEYPIRL